MNLMEPVFVVKDNIHNEHLVIGKVYKLRNMIALDTSGGVAQMVERSLSMREVPGSIPGASNLFFDSLF